MAGLKTLIKTGLVPVTFIVLRISVIIHSVMGWGWEEGGLGGEVTVHPSVCVPRLFLENIF